MTRGKSPTADVATPEALAKIESWTFNSVKEADKAALAEVMPEVRRLVAATAPQTPGAAKQMLWALTPMAIKMHRRFGVFTAATVNHDNVEIWVSQINATRPRGWCYLARSALKRIGLAVNPAGWPTQPKVRSRAPIVKGYPPLEELLYIDAAALPGFWNPEGRRWVVGGAIGAGMNGPELTAAEISDLHELGDGRLAVQVRGRHPRLVPIRDCCTGLVRQAVALVEQRPSGSDDRFVIATDKNSGARLATNVTIGRGRGFSLRRARSTWLTAHLQAETPLVALNEIAGPLSVSTLNDLLASSGVAISAQQAVYKGLGA